MGLRRELKFFKYSKTKQIKTTKKNPFLLSDQTDQNERKSKNHDKFFFKTKKYRKKNKNQRKKIIKK